MKELSILEEQLLDEYFRCKRNLIIQEKEILKYPKGNLSKKIIRGKERICLQWRDGNIVRNKTIYSYEIDKISNEIRLREKWKKSVKELKRNIKQLEKALGKELILRYENEFRR